MSALTHIAAASLVLVASSSTAVGVGVRTSVVAPQAASYDGFSVVADLGYRGAAVVGWTDDVGVVRAVVSTRATARGKFARPQRIGAGRIANVAMAPNGRHVVATWITAAGVVRATARLPRGTWRAESLPPLPPGASQAVLGLSVGSDGRATLAVEQRTEGRWRLYVMRRAGGRWTTAADMSVADVGGGNAAVNRRGDAFATWLAPTDGDGSRLLVARLPAGATAWAAADTLATSDDALSMSQPFVDGAADGSALVLSARRSASGTGDEATVYWSRPGGAWASLDVDRQASLGLSPAGRLWSASSTNGAVAVRTVSARPAWITAERAGRVTPGTLSAGPGLQAAWDTVSAWWVIGGIRGRPDRWVVSVRGPRGWSPPRQVAATTGVVGFAASPGGLAAAYVDGTRRGRVVLTEILR